MATVNITCDQNQDVNVEIEDATAEAGNHLFKFFTDGVNVFNIASQPLSGDAVDAVTVNEDTSYVFTIVQEQALLLNGSASTYKHYLIDGGTATLKNEGSVTVTPLSGTTLSTLEPFINGNNIRLMSGSGSIKADDDYVFGAPANLVEHVYELSDADTMPGKIIHIKNLGQGTVSVTTPNDTELVELNTTTRYAEFISDGDDENDWILLFKA